MIIYGALKFYNNVFAESRTQDMHLNQLKLKVNDCLEKSEQSTTNFEPSNDEDLINKVCLDGKLSKIGGRLSLAEKKYNEVKLRIDKVLNE